MNIEDIKRRFDVTGHAPELNRAIEIAIQVASTDLTVLITGESGVGKEVFPKIIHTLSARKHGPYIAVNCGAIPEGTIDSELFGHEKGSFTGAHEARKGYFEGVDGGTIFLDEVAELPLSTQVRLLRVLESGEFLKVGSSKIQKTNVRVVAATNVDLQDAVRQGRFRQDLYYRLNTVPIHVIALRDRTEDIYLLFRKFAADFSERYRMPPVALDEKAQKRLENYTWEGNVRQLKNITEQISILEQDRIIDSETLKRYLPVSQQQSLPVLFKGKNNDFSGISERDLLYKVLFDMRKDISELKHVVAELMTGKDFQDTLQGTNNLLKHPDNTDYTLIKPIKCEIQDFPLEERVNTEDIPRFSEIEDEPLKLKKQEKELIEKALQRHKGKRKPAAQDLGLSERTLYRKIKEYNIIE